MIGFFDIVKSKKIQHLKTKFSKCKERSWIFVSLNESKCNAFRSTKLGNENEYDEDIIILNPQTTNIDEITISSEEEGEVDSNKHEKSNNSRKRVLDEKEKCSTERKRKKKKKEKEKKKKKDKKPEKNEPKKIQTSKDDFKKPPEPPTAFKFEPSWQEADIIANNLGIYNVIIGKVIKLFDDGNTMPFIAR